MLTPIAKSPPAEFTGQMTTPRELGYTLADAPLARRRPTSWISRPKCPRSDDRHNPFRSGICRRLPWKGDGRPPLCDAGWLDLPVALVLGPAVRSGLRDASELDANASPNGLSGGTGARLDPHRMIGIGGPWIFRFAQERDNSSVAQAARRSNRVEIRCSISPGYKNASARFGPRRPSA